MSAEGGHLPRAASPAISGRSSPVISRFRTEAGDGPIKKDKNYRRYALGVDRALSLFDTALQEWADYISFLGRLLKALQVRPPGISDVPHKVLVAKRLSQCLNPVLPSGVHQKALEVYTYIFSLLGKDGLGRDLSLYLPGLAPTLSFASLSVKPSLLSLFDTFIVSLDTAALRPALKAIILALLPGLEEETSEEFEQTHKVLSQLRDSIGHQSPKKSEIQDASGDQFFWQCIFLATITSPSRRQGALAYLQRNLPRLGKTSKARTVSGEQYTSGQQFDYDIDAVTSPEPGLLVRCFAAGLYDDQILIQRGFLDLLVSHLPLHSVVLHEKVTPEDLGKLIVAAASVVARREMSLNRRLWAWFLGPDQISRNGENGQTPTEMTMAGSMVRNLQQNQTKYFEQYGLAPLVQSILGILESGPSTTPMEKARPFRVCLSLMDRWEIGGLVVPKIFLPAIESVRQYQRIAPSVEAFREVLRSAKVFFDGVESSLIWSEIAVTVISTFDIRDNNIHSSKEKIDLAFFTIENFNVREEEMLTVHIPFFALSLLLKTRASLSKFAESNQPVDLDFLQQVFKLTGQLIELTPGRSFLQGETWPSDVRKINIDVDNRTFQDAVDNFYGNDEGNPELLSKHLAGKNVGRLLLINSVQGVINEMLSQRFSSFEVQLSVLDKLLRKIPAVELLDANEILSSIEEASKKIASSRISLSPLKDIVAIISSIETFNIAFSSESWLADHRLRVVLPRALASVWEHLSPSRPRNNVEAVRCVWRIQALSSDNQLIESCIATLMIEDGVASESKRCNVENARRFATLWMHSNSSSGSHGRRSSLIRSSPKVSAETDGLLKDQLVLARPLLLLLDSLRDTKSETFIFTCTWLISLPNIEFIVDFLLRRLQASRCLLGAQSVASGHSPAIGDISYDIDDCLYYIETLNHLVEYTPDTIWPTLLNRVGARNMDLAEKAVESQPPKADALQPSKAPPNISDQTYLTRTCLQILHKDFELQSYDNAKLSLLRQTAVTLLEQLMVRSKSSIDLVSELEAPIIAALTWSIQKSDARLQIPLLNLASTCMRKRLELAVVRPTPSHRRVLSEDAISPRVASLERSDKEQNQVPALVMPVALLDCLKQALTSHGSQAVLHHWIEFLDNCLTMYMDSIFQVLMPLVETLTNSMKKLFTHLQNSFEHQEQDNGEFREPVSTLVALLNGLEQLLARAHDRLIQDEMSNVSVKSPEQVQGFFGNMVSGVFSSEIHKSRSSTANNRFTVLLCFKDTVRVCLEIWSWGENKTETLRREESMISATFTYTSLRLKNRTRRILEHMFAAEALECLETLIETWQGGEQGTKKELPSFVVLNLLHVLDGSRPKNTIPAVFNSIYSRTNPGALDPVRKSTLTSELSDVSLARFLVAYTLSLEDDAMDEIWSDCMTFLRDVMTNPLPHRQTLPKLLEFTAVLGTKVDNSNFGENRKRRRELGDLFVRQLAATFTIKPLSFSAEPTTYRPAKLSNDSLHSLNARDEQAPDDIVAILAAIIPNISKILIDTDRITAASNTISTQVILPTLRWKTFPRNVNVTLLELLLLMSRVTEASKVWRRDITEAFNDARLFCACSYDVAENGWLPVFRQWALLDKDRMPELLSRISSPTSAGIMFGVGATSARLEADRKTQLNFRRMATLILAAANDSFVVNLTGIHEKISDLLAATATSSPSSATRAEIYMLLRALLLKTAPVHLAPLWPTITAELEEAISSLYPDRDHDKFNVYCIVQACKLLDMLLLIAPDDFQMREWLFITDTIDAVYRPQDWESHALVDELAEDLDSCAGTLQSATALVVDAPVSDYRKPLLCAKSFIGVSTENVVNRVIRPFLRQLSISAFESTYRMIPPDRHACYDDLLYDLFDETNLV